jgi:hypothetical protein
MEEFLKLGLLPRVALALNALVMGAFTIYQLALVLGVVRQNLRRRKG